MQRGLPEGGEPGSRRQFMRERSWSPLRHHHQRRRQRGRTAVETKHGGGEPTRPRRCTNQAPKAGGHPKLRVGHSSAAGYCHGDNTGDKVEATGGMMKTIRKKRSCNTLDNQ
ncbi:hypothetical protein V1264_014967 [Littorina saxatilis]|uniref:Uncharacterized protein n=1 Tax=Littorina saxatilis TaxID=31220 RepID=A0AAN9GGG5_9CAEN